MTLVVRSIQKTPAIIEALLKSLSRSSGFRLGGIEKIGGILTNFPFLQTYPKNEPRSHDDTKSFFLSVLVSLWSKSKPHFCVRSCIGCAVYGCITPGIVKTARELWPGFNVHSLKILAVQKKQAKFLRLVRILLDMWGWSGFDGSLRIDNR